MFRPALVTCICCIVFANVDIDSAQAVDKPLPDAKIGNISVKHHWIPMRDGVRLSAYIFLPSGKGPWPVLMEQRYASLRSNGARKRYASLAAGGYAVAAVNFRGTQASEGRYVGYRALQWGEKRDGFDTVEWLAKQPWSTGKIGTVGGSQGGYAQNYLAVTQPPHLVCQFMRDTGLRTGCIMIANSVRV